MIYFTKPWFLLFLILVPFIIFIHFFSLRKKKSHALRFANFQAIARVKGIELFSKNIVLLVLTTLIFVLLTFSLSGIQYPRTIDSSVFSYALALDSSKSMEANDFSPTRMSVAKETALNFVELTPPGTTFAVLSFSGNSFIEQDLTSDKNLVKQKIKNIKISAIGGTDLSEAVITSTNLLRDEEAKTIILLSDGRINVGTVDDAIDYANENDVIVHTIGIGTVQGGETSFGLSKLDEESLKAIAFNTEGKYFSAVNKTSLQDSLFKILEFKRKKVSTDLSSHFLVIAIISFIVEYILYSTRYRIFP